MDVCAWALRLYDAGLIPLACWGGGKALPGTSHRCLADNPPSRDVVGQADYSGGLSILLGTRHPAGGFVTGIDIDQGPSHFPSWPQGFLMAEEGTAKGKWHLFLRTIGRLHGQINLKDTEGKLVAEIKGYGLSLRSWPTQPEGKPRGYRVVALAHKPDSDPPKLTAMQLAEAMRDFLSCILGKEVRIESSYRGEGRCRRPVPVPEGLARRIEQELGQRGVVLRPSGRDGWRSGKCPFHEDTKPSFSISYELGLWKCWAGCGSGGLRSLARRLGLRRYGRPRAHLITSWEVQG